MPNLERILELVHAELRFDFVRSSGPGGQNVNKVATSAELRFDVNRSGALAAPAKERLIDLAGRRVNGEGVLLIEARRHRTQEQNRADAIARLDSLIGRALEPPKKRLPTRASAASKERRLLAKKKRGESKRLRRERSFEG